MRFLQKLPQTVLSLVMIGFVTLVLGIALSYLPELLVNKRKVDVPGLPTYLSEAIGKKAYGMPLETFTLPQGELKKPAVGEEAPDFSLPSAQGGKISLSDFRGKTVVLDFTTTWCGMTFAEHDNFSQIQKEYGDKVVFLTVDSYSYDKLEDLVSYQREYKREWLFVLDKTLDVAKVYGVRQTVSTFVIDKEGVIRYSDNWITGFEELDKILQQVT